MLALRAKADRGCFFNRTPIFSEFLFFRYLKRQDEKSKTAVNPVASANVTISCDLFSSCHESRMCFAAHAHHRSKIGTMLSYTTWNFHRRGDSFVYFPLGFANESNPSEATPQTNKTRSCISTPPLKFDSFAKPSGK